MRCLPSKRNLDLVTFLDQGNSLHETAAHFFLKPTEVLRIERLTRDYIEATEALERDPADLMLLARIGRLTFAAARALAEQGIRRIYQLNGATSRDLMCVPKIGRGAAEEIVKLAAERGIEIKGALPPRRTATVDPPRQWLRKAPALSARDPIGMGVRSAADKLGAISIRSSIGPSRQTVVESDCPSRPIASELVAGHMPDMKGARGVAAPYRGPDGKAKAGRSR